MYFVTTWPCLKEDHELMRQLMVMSRSVRTCSNPSCILSLHDHAWKKIMTRWEEWWWCHSLFPQQIIMHFVVTQPHLKEDRSSKSQTNNPLNHIPFLDTATQPPLPPPPPPHPTHLHTAPPPTAALTFSMAAPTSCGNGPLLPMQVMQP